MAGDNVYNSENDTAVGQPVAQRPRASAPASGVYDSARDTSIGVDPAAPPEVPWSNILQTPWAKISDGAAQMWKTAGGAIHAFDTPENREASGQGLVRGLRNVSDKFGEYPNPEVGYTPPPEDIETVRRQNASDRAEAYKKYGDNPSFNAGTMLGETGATAPFLGPLGSGLSAALRVLGVPILARGAIGLLARTGERLFTGGVTGGTQAALTSDPSQPLGPQIKSGIITGAAIPAAGGLATDVGSNAVRRVTGRVTPINPYDGNVLDTQRAKAEHAQVLLDEGVPISGSQVSNDPLLGAVDRYGSHIPVSGSADYAANQQQVFRNAALRRVDPTERGSIVDEPFVTRNDDAIDNMYGGSVRAVRDVPSLDANGVTIHQDFNRIRGNIPNGLTPEARDQIHGAMGDIEDAFNRGNGAITGADAHRLTRRTNSALSPLLDSSNGDLRNYAQQIRAEMDRRLRDQMTPQQQVMFDQANQQFRALRTIQNAADSTGSFTPGALHGSAREVADRFNSPGTLDRLAQAGDSVLQPTLDSRTALGPRVAGNMSPYMAGASTAAAAKYLMDYLTSGAVGVTGVGAGLAGNRALQAVNRASGQRAVNTTLAGGGRPTWDVPGLLSLARMAGVSNQEDLQRPPSQ